MTSEALTIVGKRVTPFFSIQAVLAVLLIIPDGAHSAFRATAPAQAKGADTTAAASAELLDINTATAAALAQLPGMGAAYARRVVDGRPYTAKNQLVTRGVLPEAAYARIRDRIIAHRVAPVTAP